MQVDGLTSLVPFRYVPMKVGYVVDVPLNATYSAGRPSFSRGDEHYYRMVPSHAGPTILVAFGDDFVTYR